VVLLFGQLNELSGQISDVLQFAMRSWICIAGVVLLLLWLRITEAVLLGCFTTAQVSRAERPSVRSSSITHANTMFVLVFVAHPATSDACSECLVCTPPLLVYH
jgi:hypothetical protein